MSFRVVIPARFGSSRLPGKPLLPPRAQMVAMIRPGVVVLFTIVGISATH